MLTRRHIRVIKRGRHEILAIETRHFDHGDATEILFNAQGLRGDESNRGSAPDFRLGSPCRLTRLAADNQQECGRREGLANVEVCGDPFFRANPAEGRGFLASGCNLTWQDRRP